MRILRNFFLLIILLGTSYGATIFSLEPGNHLIELEFGLYYMPLGWTIPLTGKPIPRIDTEEESKVYKYFLKNFYKPRFLVLEVSTYPMPLVGWACREYWYPFYRRAKITDSLNWIESLTAIFYEPWAVSLFLGNIATYKPHRWHRTDGKAMLGYLVSYGNYWFKRNVDIHAHWLEWEVKFKGELKDYIRAMKWSIRMGGRVHFHDDIKDTLYFAFKRSRTDFDFRKFSLLRNAYYDLRMDLGFDKFHLIGGSIKLGKKFPFRERKVALSFILGVIWRRSPEVRGELAELAKDPKFIFIFVPNLEF